MYIKALLLCSLNMTIFSFFIKNIPPSIKLFRRKDFKKIRENKETISERCL